MLTFRPPPLLADVIVQSAKQAGLTINDYVVLVMARALEFELPDDTAYRQIFTLHLAADPALCAVAEAPSDGVQLQAKPIPFRPPEILADIIIETADSLHMSITGYVVMTMAQLHNFPIPTRAVETRHRLPVGA